MNSRLQVPMPQTRSSLRRFGIDFLKFIGSPTPELDTRILLQAASGLSHEAVISRSNETVPEQEQEVFQSYLNRRGMGEPVHRIIGKREFFGREFFVSISTLIPRPETELLVEAALRYLSASTEPARVLEIGTGSGAVAISLVLEAELRELAATDVCEGALITAKKNASNLGVQDKIRFEMSDVRDGIAGTYDMIVSNPPYIASKDISELDDAVKLYDPLIALDGGPDGLDIFRAILESAANALTCKGLVLLEMGYGQGGDVAELAMTRGFDLVEIIPDLAGIERIVVLRKKQVQFA